MTAGILSKAGYYMGDELYDGDEANPKGYFEDKEINLINEELLAQILPARPTGIFGKLFFRSRPVLGQRWLAQVPIGTTIPVPSLIAARIKAQVAHKPFCFKDPRFCYTLPAWRPLINDAVFICVFRHPGETVTSILKECRRADYLHSLKIDFSDALRVWKLMYQHILQVHYKPEERWLFVHYNQLLEGSVLRKFEEVLGAEVDRSFADAKYKRSSWVGDIPDQIKSIYERLCELSGYSD